MNRQQKRYVLDVSERVIATFAVAFLGQLIASGWFTVGGVIDMSIVQKAGLAGIAAALSLLKGMAAKLIGSPNTAAFLSDDSDTPRPD